MDLVLARGTLRHVPFLERVAAASSAGFRSLGMGVREYADLRASGWTDTGLRAVLDDHGVRVREAEVLAGFAATGSATHPELRHVRYGDAAGEAAAFAMADALGVRHLQVCGAFQSPPEPHAASALAALCRRAAAHGLLVALEAVPCTSVPDLPTAVDLVSQCGPNAGLCVDVWHWRRGSHDPDHLTSLPPDRIVSLQLDDGPLVPRDPDFLTDTLHFRDLPGEGEFDLPEFLRLLPPAALSVPIGVEVMSDALDLLPPAEAARRAYDATVAVLQAAPAPTLTARTTASRRKPSVR